MLFTDRHHVITHPIASYCSIKRLALENLSSLKIDHLLNAIGITIKDIEIDLSTMCDG